METAAGPFWRRSPVQAQIGPVLRVSGDSRAASGTSFLVAAAGDRWMLLVERLRSRQAQRVAWSRHGYQVSANSPPRRQLSG